MRIIGLDPLKNCGICVVEGRDVKLVVAKYGHKLTRLDYGIPAYADGILGKLKKDDLVYIEAPTERGQTAHAQMSLQAFVYYVRGKMGDKGFIINPHETKAAVGLGPYAAKHLVELGLKTTLKKLNWHVELPTGAGANHMVDAFCVSLLGMHHQKLIKLPILRRQLPKNLEESVVYRECKKI